MGSSYDPRGSLWHRWDLHFHSPSSFDYDNSAITNQQIVDGLLQHNVRVVAITDHHTIDVPRVKELRQLAADKLTILPGIELRSDQGGEPIHYICIFPEDCNLDHVWTTLQGKLELTAEAIAERGGQDRIYVPLEKAHEAVVDLDGVISIHAGTKSNSIESIRNTEQFQQRIKFDITNQYVDLMEVGQLKDIDIHLNIIFPATKLSKPLLVCSDNHDIEKYEVKAPMWFRSDPTFRGLLMVLREPKDRVFIGDIPPEMLRVQRNPTKYIRNLSFKRGDGTPVGEKWFGGTVVFNPGLVAIVGNKGSGKSALGDTLGLLGATKNADQFSFLSRERFRHPTAGRAEHFSATITWESEDQLTKCLADPVAPKDVERVKYLPQDHVERVCNELGGDGTSGFEHELQSVIFSHVPETSRLQQTNLEDLVRFQTQEKQRRIDTLLKQLRAVSRERALIESRLSPRVKEQLQQRIAQLEAELSAHDKVKPAEVKNPAVGAVVGAPSNELLTELTSAESAKGELEQRIRQTTENIAKLERRQAIVLRLLEKLSNFQKDFDVFQSSLATDATELGLNANGLVSFSINKEEPEKIRVQTAKELTSARGQLDGPVPDGLRKQLADATARIVDIRGKLDAPNRNYQAYLERLAEWRQKRQAIEGTETDPQSLKGLKASLSALDSLPAEAVKLRQNQSRIALEIHVEKLAQAAVYRTLYEPVQTFINSHPLAKDKLKLEFRAELAEEGFPSRLFELLAQNRRGSFMGLDEGQARLRRMREQSNWQEPESLQRFLEQVDHALHNDQREENAPAVQLTDQLLRGRTTEEVFNLLYGLEYIRPRYILRWEGKDLSMLSPGERGTLLLVFYLLIDKSDVPLLIDQPEGNLDNHTVAKVLVDCLKATRERRQVFIITHNPNLAVVCDADQIIHAEMKKVEGNEITYKSGSLENPEMSTFITDVLEGTRWAFNVRRDKYSVSDGEKPSR